MVLHVEQFVGRTRVISSAVALIALLTGCQADDPTGASATETGGELDTTLAIPGTTGELPTTTWDTNWDPSAPDGTGGMSGTTTTTGPTDETTGSVDPSTTTTTSTTGDEGVDCEVDPENPLCEIPPEDHEPTTPDDGVPSPIPGVYDDLGPAPPDNGVRALIGFPTRDRAKLEALVEDIYDPASPNFRKYITPEQWMADHAPKTEDVTLIKAWLQNEGFTVNWVAGNRMLIHFSGTAADFNETFQTELHICMRKNPQQGLPPFPVYCVIDVDGFTLPKFVSDRTTGLLTADLPAEAGMLSNEGGKVIADPPGPGGYGPGQIAGAYGLKPLYEAGFNGQGSSIGVIGAGTYHSIDLQIFWASFGISRALPTRVSMMEPVHERITETILDTQWSTSMAPGAAVTVYEGPDARNTSLLYLWNEAIHQNEVDVITNSFAHREDSEPKPLRHQYDESALEAAALGITLVSASGDSARPDTPCGSPYVTCVGGTRLQLNDNGDIVSEVAWTYSGSGDSKSFPVPYWQDGEDINETRAVSDVALSASPAYPHWIRRYGNWEAYGGTSFSSPMMAGVIATINGKRKAEGKPRLGFLNPLLYLHQPTRDSFRDITGGGTDMFDAKTGWDYPTGLGAPDAEKLAAALP